MTITAKELMELADLTTDGVVGWEAQIAMRTARHSALWPEHFRGPRIEAFEAGARLARDWIAMRHGYGMARRKIRIRDFREEGATSCIRISSAPANERHAEQLSTLREVVVSRDRRARIHAQS